jgi:phage-related protein
VNNSLPNRTEFGTHKITKRVIWHLNAREALQEFPKEVRNMLGYLLYRLQRGDTLDMPHSKPMPAIAKGAYELRAKSADGAYRAFYYFKCEEGILVFHCFKKKTQKTLQSDIERGVKNLKELLS